jgi:anti-sigma regulatory factor (Ser/Thr protein kinase)
MRSTLVVAGGATRVVVTGESGDSGVCRSGDRVVLTIPAKPEYVSLCRLALAGLGQRCGLDLETVADLKVAVTEACSHAIRCLAHDAATDGATRCVEVEIGVEPEAWVITVGEWGSDAENGQGEDEDPPSEDALSLTVIRALVDQVTRVSRNEKCVALVMSKRLL